MFSLEDRASLRAQIDRGLEGCDWKIGNRLAGVIGQGPDMLEPFALDDWAMLLPNTGLDGAVAVAERAQRESSALGGSRAVGCAIRSTGAAGLAGASGGSPAWGDSRNQAARGVRHQQQPALAHRRGIRVSRGSVGPPA